MKFKGFWRSLWDLENGYFKWLKDYWLAYTTLVVVACSVVYIPYIWICVKEYRKQKQIEKLRKEEQEFIRRRV